MTRRFEVRRKDGRMVRCSVPADDRGEDMIPIHEQVEALLRVLDNRLYRERLIAELFPGTTVGYQKEWMSRTPVGFWCHLDIAHRNRALKIAADIAL